MLLAFSFTKAARPVRLDLIFFGDFFFFCRQNISLLPQLYRKNVGVICVVLGNFGDLTFVTSGTIVQTVSEKQISWKSPVWTADLDSQTPKDRGSDSGPGDGLETM